MAVICAHSTNLIAMAVASSTASAPRPLSSLRVAVIGAGAAGLAAAREIRREGHGVVVFEPSSRAGGTWIYTPEVESDPLGLDPTRKVVHGSLYSSLRTNLPRECMGFLDYPFVDGPGGDQRRFPGHVEVLRYLQDFARDFGLEELVRFESEVVRVGMTEGDRKWAVMWRNLNGGDNSEEETEIYDGVVVCNGHYTQPSVSEIPDIEAWPGKQMHSHNFRVPEPFHNQVVVIIGSSASAVDISRDIATVAKEVHIASRSATEGTPTKQPGYDNLWLHPMIESTRKDGTVVFQDGSSASVDVIIHCTGYKYHFPFLETNGILTVDDNRVGPLYKHVFPPLLAPWLSFIGLPSKVLPFPLFELQSKWVAGILAGRIALPSQEDMTKDVEAFYLEMEATEVPKRYTHNTARYQFDYDDWLANECNHPGVEDWRKLMYGAALKNRIVRPESYRDEWEDEHLVAEALEDFKRFL